MMTEVELRETMTRKDIQPGWKKICVKPDQVLEVMLQQYHLYKNDQHWKKQILDSRQLVAEQLSGVSQVMEDLAKEIKREGQELFMQEEQIRSALEELGLAIHSIDIISLDEAMSRSKSSINTRAGLTSAVKLSRRCCRKSWASISP